MTNTQPPPTPPSFACPLFEDLQQVREQSRDLVKSMRRLRRKLRTCRRCTAFENCLVLAEFNADLQAAISQVVDGWSQDASNF